MNTPIGIEFDYYLNQSHSPEEDRNETAKLARRVFSDPVLMRPRIDALRVLVDGLYDSGEPPSNDLLEKVRRLHEQLEKHQAEMHAGLLDKLPPLHGVMPYLIAVAFMSGSNQLRLQIRMVSQKMYKYVSGKSTEMARPLPPGQGLLGGYSPRMAYSTFMHSAMSYMILESLRGMGEMGDPGELRDSIDLSPKEYLFQFGDL